VKFHTFIVYSNTNKIVMWYFIIYGEVVNFLSDLVVISDVHGTFAERKTHHIYTETQKTRRHLNNMITRCGNSLSTLPPDGRPFGHHSQGRCDPDGRGLISYPHPLAMIEL